MQKLTELEEKIREVNPELKELAWGCEAHIRKGNCLNKYIINCTHHDTDGTKRYKVSCLDDKLFNPEDFTEIIGHPIQLQHILRAIPYKRFCNLVMNEEDGTGIVVDDSDLIPYNLTLPLEQQAPEVIDFLHSIICEG